MHFMNLEAKSISGKDKALSAENGLRTPLKAIGSVVQLQTGSPCHRCLNISSNDRLEASALTRLRLAAVSFLVDRPYATPDHSDSQAQTISYHLDTM